MGYFTTGSGEKPNICFVDGDTAFAQYGVTKRYANMCPNCHFPIVQLLAFNPTEGNYYLSPCPVCGKFIRYCDINGDLVSNFIIVTSDKRTPSDIDLNVEDRYSY